MNTNHYPGPTPGGRPVSNLNRREFLAGAAGAAGKSAAPARPNILFVMVDEMRFDALRCAGHPFIETPNLDRLARQGTRFENAYTVSPVCCPARASAFTGRYAHVHGVTINDVPANEGEVFLPSILKHYGYHTAISGKLHFSPQRFDYGFDKFWTFTSEGPTPELGLIAHCQRKYGSRNKWTRVEGSCPWPDDPLGKDVGLFRWDREDFETEWITDRSIEYLRSRQGSGQPWFLFTSYLKPHSPSVEMEPWFSKYSPGRMPMPKLPPNARHIRMSVPENRRRQFVDDEKMIRVMSAIYYGMTSHVDENLGRLFGELDKLGMADQTLILFTADHGNMLGDRGRWFKGLQYEGSAHVPLIWRGPKGSAENTGKTIRPVVEGTDVMPAILETAGIPIPEGVQGRSFLSLARGRDKNWKDRSFSQLRGASYVEGGFKTIDDSLDGTGARELYDLRNDPREERNLADEPKHRDRVQHALAELRKWRADRPLPIRVPGMSAPEYAHLSARERAQYQPSRP